MGPEYRCSALYDGSMARSDLLCEVRGRVITPDGTPLVGASVEFLPSRPYFVLDDVTYCPMGARLDTLSDGTFLAMLTRTDLTGINYLTRGALGTYLIRLDGPGPLNVSALLKAGRRLAPSTHDS